jgi:hypothetical protein
LVTVWTRGLIIGGGALLAVSPLPLFGISGATFPLAEDYIPDPNLYNTDTAYTRDAEILADAYGGERDAALDQWAANRGRLLTSAGIAGAGAAALIVGVRLQKRASVATVSLRPNGVGVAWDF